MNRHVVISGCSGGGKSTLLAALAKRGFAIVEEPGRRIVAEELSDAGTALPWIDLAAFARRAIATALADKAGAAAIEHWVFFDRSLVDAVAALEHASGEPDMTGLAVQHRYHRRVFIAPPWPGLFARDHERRHDFADAVAECDRLLRAYARFGYEIVELPRFDVEQRADFILAHL